MTKRYTEIARIPSESNPSRIYKISKNDQDDEISCNCPAWVFYKKTGPRTCKHIVSLNNVGLQENLANLQEWRDKISEKFRAEQEDEIARANETVIPRNGERKYKGNEYAEDLLKELR